MPIEPTQQMPSDSLVKATTEFGDLPGRILGLDGWVLRSLPTEHRERFLRGYEKLLATVFHPDRYTDTEKKRSREAYLQTVSQAIGFMLGDPFAFDAAIEAVPTHKNPMVQAKQALAAREVVVDHLQADLAELQAASVVRERELADALRRASETLTLANARTAADWKLRRVLRKIVLNEWPVPTASAATVTGHWFKIENRPALLEKITTLARGEGVSEHSVFAQANWPERSTRITKKAMEGQVRNDALTINGKRYWIAGATTLAHIVEWVRHALQFGKDRMESDTIKAIAQLLELAVPDLDTLEDHARAQAMLLPFYCRSMFLVVRDPETGQGLLWLVKSVNSKQSVAYGELKHAEQENRKLRSKWSADQRKWKNWLKEGNDKVVEAKLELRSFKEGERRRRAEIEALHDRTRARLDAARAELKKLKDA